MNPPRNFTRRTARRLTHVGVIASVVVLSSSVAQAQAVAPTSASTTSTAAEPKGEVVELTPFEVRANLDTGYMGFETASGSRLNTKLSDTPASISVFTA